ncbi:cop9 signalosome subunit 6 [Stagonosporopsis vannaccii]|nr:cop9 signalosome subunit 6 [Stagonosporopsis vannaccii]
MADTTGNPLLSTSRASDTSPVVQLHPLVLLTISDCISRHTLRQQPGPVVGAILGAQNGQEVTMEVAFQAKLNASADAQVTLDDEWFSKRLEDFKEVHKQPQLDLVGWFTLGPASGPGSYVLPIHSRITELYNESPILLLFHPESTYTEATAAGKLPLTLYESLSENAPNDPNDKAMDIDGAAQAKTIKFRELVYSVETGEAEMISVDFVARGGGNATAVEGSVGVSAPAAETPVTSDNAGKKGKGKQKEKDGEKDAPIDEAAVLDADDEEILSSLTAKMNAVRMLSRRVALLRAYLDALPPSHLSDPSLPMSTASDAHPLPLDHTILRSISATLARLNILAPPDSEAFSLESQQEASDVQLVNLLASITNSVSSAKELGRKSQIVENAKSQGKSRMGNIMGGYGGPPEGNFFDIGGGAGGLRAGGERWS